MIETLKKSKGKSKPIRIDGTVRNKVASFKLHLRRLLDDPATTPQEHKAISYILNNLEPYEQNILIAYFEFGNDAAEMMGINTSVLHCNVRRILNKIPRQ